MSNRRGSISDYPEHLNPFYEGNEKLRFWKFGRIKRSGSFGETLRNTLTLKSFRGKKKDKQAISSSPPEIRKQAPIVTPRQRQTLPATLSPIYSPRNTAGPALPRSRFSERVRKSSLNSEEVPNGHIPSTSPEISAPANPFEENEKVADVKARRIRRRKRRAPLPPNMAREEGDDPYLGVSSRHNFSKWSLTSVETDISTYSENENLSLDTVNQEMCEIMNTITKEMEKLTVDTNSNNSSPTKETSNQQDHSEMPDLIASSTEVIKREETHENASINVASKYEDKEQPTDENSNVVPTIVCENIEEEETEHRNNSDEEAQKIEDSSCTDTKEEAKRDENNEDTPDDKKELDNPTNCDVSKDTSSTEEELKNVNNCDENEDAVSKTESDSNSICEKSDPNILYNATYNHAASVQDLNYNERKSLYITASNDQLDKFDSLTDIDNTTKVTENVDINQNNHASPPMSPRCKTQVNLILNNSAQESQEQEVENADSGEEAVDRPIPKTRTGKLSKSDLLGNELTQNN